MRNFLLIIFTFILLCAYRYPLTQYREYKKMEELKKEIKNSKYSIKSEEKEIENLLIKHGIRFPQVVLIQSFLETGNYTSLVYRRNNNCCGMKFNSRGFAKKKNLNHAYYDSLEDCIKDQAAWQKIMINSHERYFNKKIVTEEDYYFFLEHIIVKNNIYRYAEDINYIGKLKNLKEKREEKLSKIEEYEIKTFGKIKTQMD